MTAIKIGNKIIGENHPVFIIAEAGVNHNGEIEQAKKLVDIAVKTGADAVKFQTFNAEGVVTPDIDSADYAVKNIGKDIKQLDLIKSLELSNDDFISLKNYCDEKGIIFLSTPHSFDAIDFLDDLVPAYKFGSGDLLNIPALKHAAEKGKPIILGTGMATMDDVKIAVDTIKSVGNNQIVLLHCTTNYPCPIEETNLRSMQTMQRELDCIIGYSDHTMGIIVPIIATAMGANVIEKHFTIDKNLSGPDHKASLEEDELEKMITEVRVTEKILGSHEKQPTNSEKKIMTVVRKSLISKMEIRSGSIITVDMIDIKRPGTGIQPYDMDKIIGKKAKINIDKNEIFQLDMVE